MESFVIAAVSKESLIAVFGVVMEGSFVEVSFNAFIAVVIDGSFVRVSFRADFAVVMESLELFDIVCVSFDFAFTRAINFSNSLGVGAPDIPSFVAAINRGKSLGVIAPGTSQHNIGSSIS